MHLHNVNVAGGLPPGAVPLAADANVMADIVACEEAHGVPDPWAVWRRGMDEPHVMGTYAIAHPELCSDVKVEVGCGKTHGGERGGDGSEELHRDGYEGMAKVANWVGECVSELMLGFSGREKAAWITRGPFLCREVLD